MYIRRVDDIASLVRSVRISQGLNQQSLADKLGVSRLWINELEGGKATVQLDLVLRAVNELGITLTATTGDEVEAVAARPKRKKRPLIDIDEIADTGLEDVTRKRGR